MLTRIKLQLHLNVVMAAIFGGGTMINVLLTIDYHVDSDPVMFLLFAFLSGIFATNFCMQICTLWKISQEKGITNKQLNSSMGANHDYS